MLVTFYRSNRPFEHRLAESFESCVKNLGHDFQTIVETEYDGPIAETDVAIAVGVKGNSRLILNEHRLLNKNVIMIDKGYARIPNQEDRALKVEYWRMSVNAFQPLAYFQKIARPSDRWDKLGQRVLSPRDVSRNEHILYVGSSQKYCTFQKLGDATEFATTVFRRIRKYRRDKTIIYRPKPSWKAAVPIPETIFSHGPGIDRDIAKSCCVVTHGSNGALDAIRLATPALVLGDSIARPVAMTEYSQLAEPQMFFPSEEQRYQLFYDLSYCQFTMPEVESGEAWQYFEPHFE
jgi:hypothetical protein